MSAESLLLFFGGMMSVSVPILLLVRKATRIEANVERMAQILGVTDRIDRVTQLEHDMNNVFERLHMKRP